MPCGPQQSYMPRGPQWLDVTLTLAMAMLLCTSLSMERRVSGWDSPRVTLHVATAGSTWRRVGGRGGEQGGGAG